MFTCGDRGEKIKKNCVADMMGQTSSGTEHNSYRHLKKMTNEPSFWEFQLQNVEFVLAT